GEDAVTVVSGSADCSSSAAANSPVSGSPYVISCTEGTLDAANYDFTTFRNADLTLTKAPLVVTAEDATREYGDANPAFTHHINGFKNGEQESDLTGPPDCVSIASATSPVPGPYAITCSGAASGNYDFSYEAGQLTLTKAPLTVTADDAAREYGDANPNFTHHISGFKNGEPVASPPATAPPRRTTPADAPAPVAQ